MDKLEFFSFLEAPKSLKQEWKSAISQVLDSGVFIGGPAVTKFETEWANYLEVKHVIGVGNGYDALVVALKILGIGPGDLVAVPSHTFIASWLAVAAVGAIPVGIDCNSSGLMNVEILESSNKNYSAVIPVHMHGQMVDMPRLVRWAKERDVRVIEDCAQAHGARFNGKLAGTWGEFGAFSFYPTKNLGALGDAGSLVTNDDSLAANARSYINYGSVPGNKYEYQFNGINSRLDPIQAAVLSVNLNYLDTWNARRQEIAEIYLHGLTPLGIKTLTIERDSVFHHFIVESVNRDLTKNLLDASGIKTEIHYPESAEESFSKFGGKCVSSETKNAVTLSKKTLSLPISQWMSEVDAYHVIEAVTDANTLRSFLGEM
jgi:dTDP-4-amino-4,6-dideoxygalactose transaminase